VLNCFIPLLPFLLVLLATRLEANAMTMLPRHVVVSVAAVFGALIKHKSNWTTSMNIVIMMVEIGVLVSVVWSQVTVMFTGDTLLKAQAIPECGDFNFDFGELTVGQVVSASSAAAGAGAVRPWVQSIIEAARQHMEHLMRGLHCDLSDTILGQVTNTKVATKDEFLKLMGCKDEPSAQTADRWCGYLQDMAVKMKLTNSHGESNMGNMAFDSGYNDNSGLAPILSNYLESDTDEAQVLVLVMNGLGDNQMETYFNSTSGNNNGGMFCEDKITDTNMKKVFRKMDAIREKSFEQIGGKYVKQEHESTCAIRLPRTLFFEGDPPQHHRFKDNRIPAHMTYAYKEGVTIARNDDFYSLPEGKTKKIDLLFVNANAPVELIALPEDGSAQYVGLAKFVELAMEEISREFPAYFVEEGGPSSKRRTPDYHVDESPGNDVIHESEDFFIL
jgi:hypothetical protein